jgi:hypothetical protein
MSRLETGIWSMSRDMAILRRRLLVKPSVMVEKEAAIA